MKKSLVCIGSAWLIAWGATAAEKPERWSLQDCLDYALENNIQVQKTKVAQLSGEEDYLQARARMFPSLSASVSQGFVNYPSNAVERNNSYNGNYSVNASWTLFDGGRRTKNIEQQEIQNERNVLATEQSEDDIRISIVQTYLQVMYAIESVQINANTVEVSRAQRDRAKELLAAGALSQVELAQLESEYSSAKYQLVVAQNSVESYTLQLKQLLELELSERMELEELALTDDAVLRLLPEKEEIYTTALAVMPQVKSSALAIEQSELAIQSAKGGYLPSVSLNAGIGTGHLSGTNYTFGSQVWNSFNESIGLSISIPIYSNRENKTAVNKARYALTTSRLDLLNTQKELLNTVERIYLDATSAQSQYLSATERLKYVNESYTLTEEQFNLGMKNTLEMLTEKNNQLNAQQEALQSKYMAVMSMQLLNIYQKKGIDIN